MPRKKNNQGARNRNQGPHRDKSFRSHADSNLKPKASNGYFLFGRNSVETALQNKNRECVRLIGTEKALSNERITSIRPNIETVVINDTGILDATVGTDSPHQGILLEVRPLPGTDIESLHPVDGKKNIILMLDQVTDPHNVGACMRSAAAFGARALITQDRNSPSESGTLARSAAGGLETLDWLRVANLSQALDTLKEMGYWHVGLDGNTETKIRDVKLGDNIVIVMGSEGKGMRPLTRKSCDMIAKIPMSGQIESLNVSNAAAIALYEIADQS
ncbi:23S rRNA (guanosine(2251)-2'-O)-methyltransferase RlmB [Kordiimonas laminariae]|uniref:23S rRNA (guanosine(2251)-2'-O)-methyltransferase RlmB n=1 Tax=Kordiimonas laminariae TaxID=2917717 RepID=UPI001FF4267F|nr:23S rRNA (guanosine(2251)-2'-O)-methyltransferase RlmB [Kordiimonas laminariae]MCK0070594.1 23S rRNA (guanosine(2251)-2'-O)-methyltransferase RlmB [Kordiimonas laminariae]